MTAETDQHQLANRFGQALRRIAANGVNGSAWCVAVAGEALGTPIRPRENGSYGWPDDGKDSCDARELAQNE